MVANALLDLSTAEVDEKVDHTLTGLAKATPTQDPTRRRRLRDLLKPQANGDQDSW